MPGGKGNGVVDARHGQDADRAARTMDEADIGRHQVRDAIAEDGVGVAAAELHQAVVPVRAYRGSDRRGQSAGQVLVAELVDVLHAGTPGSPSTRTPACRIRSRVSAASSALMRFSA